MSATLSDFDVVSLNTGESLLPLYTNGRRCLQHLYAAEKLHVVYERERRRGRQIYHGTHIVDIVFRNEEDVTNTFVLSNGYGSRRAFALVLIVLLEKLLTCNTSDGKELRNILFLLRHSDVVFDVDGVDPEGTVANGPHSHAWWNEFVGNLAAMCTMFVEPLYDLGAAFAQFALQRLTPEERRMVVYTPLRRRAEEYTDTAEHAQEESTSSNNIRQRHPTTPPTIDAVRAIFRRMMAKFTIATLSPGLRDVASVTNDAFDICVVVPGGSSEPLHVVLETPPLANDANAAEAQQTGDANVNNQNNVCAD